MAPYLQSLLPQRQGLDPDATFSSVPYDKGAWFLRTLEQRVGREVFDPFLRGWFDGHAFESADTDTFLNHLRGHLLVEHPPLRLSTEKIAVKHRNIGTAAYFIPIHKLRCGCHALLK
jgi:hypothetical protein